MQKIISKFILSLFLVTLLFAPARPEESSSISNTKVLAQFNIAHDTQAILLPVEFKGKEYLFELDTGSSHTLFDISLKNMLGKPRKLVKGKTPVGLMKLALFDAPEAFLGPLNLKDCRTVSVVNLEQVSLPLGRRIHGIIGMNFLKKYVVQIDFEQATVSFLESTNDSLFSFIFKPKNQHPEWGEMNPIKFKHIPNVPYIRGNIDGNKVDFLIDTGLKHYSNKSPVNHFRGKLESKTYNKIEPKIQFEYKRIAIITVQGKYPSEFKKFSAIGRFSIGSLKYKDVFFDQSDKSSLGISFLSRHLVTFDFPNQQMYLKQGNYFNTARTDNVLIKDAGFSLSRKSEHIFVSSIEPDSPAFKKDIKKNDIVLKIDEQDVTSYGLIELIELLSQFHNQENKSLIFTIKRGNEIKQKSFNTIELFPEKMELNNEHYNLIFN